MATMYSGLGGPAGYGENVFSTSTKAAGGNDDGSVAIDVTSIFPGGIDFYGTSYSTIYLNSNGTISFGTPETSYQSAGIGGETTPMLAPFFADVNINSGGEIYWDIDPAAGTITMTWDGVAPYSGSGNNSFQVQITSTGSGDYTVEYIYEDIQWAGDPADAGMTDGGSNDVLLDGTADSAELLNYENKDFGSGTNGSYIQSFSGGAPSLADGDVDGTDSDDSMLAGHTDADGDQIGNTDDLIYGNGGDDTIAASGGADTVYGGEGDDSILGEAGNDVLHGDAPAATTGSESLNWTASGANGTDISGGISQDTGGMTVDVTFVRGPISGGITTSSTTQYTGTGEPFATGSALRLTSDGSGAGTNATTTIDFSTDGATGLSNEVENVSFRINDIDTSSWQDIVTVNAYDADGNPVTVTLTAAGNDAISGNTITAGAGNDSASDANGSVLVEIAGPLSSIEIVYANGNTATQALWVTDVHFDTLAIQDGGNDTLAGGAGDDALYGGHGDDSFIVNGAEGSDTISGGETGQTGGDTLIVQNTGSSTNTTLTGDGTGTVAVGADTHTVSEIEVFEFTSNTVDTFDGSADAEGLTVRSFGGADDITTGSGDDSIDGGSGNDTLAGGTGNDTIEGGADADLFEIDDNAGTDTLTGGEGGDDFDMVAFGNVLTNIGVNVTVTGNEAGTYAYPGAGANADGSFSQIEGIQGTDFGDTIDGSAATSDMYYDGQAGDDTISGGAGDDTMLGGAGNESFVIAAGFGNDSITGGETGEISGDALDMSAISDDITLDLQASGTTADPESGTATTTSGDAITFSEIEAITLGTGDDTVTGSTGADTVVTGAGADVVDGQEGADRFDLGAGADTATVAQGDTITGGGGDDLFTLTDLGETGSATISITGGEGGETSGDTLDFQGLIDWGDVVYTNTDDAAGGLTGYATLADGSVVNFTEIENVIICFTAGTRIVTPHGPRLIEDLSVGDLVLTADDGVQPIRWIGARTVPAKGKLAPVRIKAGTRFGNERDLLVSPQHRMLLSGCQANLLFGEYEVLAAAKHLLNGDDVYREQGGTVTYVHMLFDRHQIVYAEGAPSESFHPGAQGLEAVMGPAREELFTLFPDLRTNPNGYGDTSRMCLKQHEARLLP